MAEVRKSTRGSGGGGLAYEVLLVSPSSATPGRLGVVYWVKSRLYVFSSLRRGHLVVVNAAHHYMTQDLRECALMRHFNSNVAEFYYFSG